jgi:prepilin-type N-terminal cleavage/methylation domain-containing protein
MKQKGFTLIELLIVIAILGVLAAVSLIKLTGPQAKARDTRRQSDLKQYQTALEVYASRSNDTYPVANGNLNSLCATLGITGSTCVDDPKVASGWDLYQYRSNNTGGVATQYVVWGRMEKTSSTTVREYFVLCSSGQAGIVQNSVNANNGVCPL